MDKRYQVFISSTYRDLKEERMEVQQALLELDCFPAGMELFPAADEDQWSLIRKVIDLSDFYVIIVAARYGSVNTGAGLSYTEMEFDYARTRNIPILGFVHADPGSVRNDHTDDDPNLKVKLEAFREKVMTGRVVKTYTSSSDLGSKVSRALTAGIKASNRPGWVRGDRALTPAMELETATLRAQLAEAQSAAAESGQPSSELDLSFAHGGEGVSIGYTYETFNNGETIVSRGSVGLTWDTVLNTIAPSMVTEASEWELRTKINRYLSANWSWVDGQELAVDSETWDRIVTQFRALGAIAPGTRKRPANDSSQYWVLTTAGDRYMMQQMARRSSIATSSET